MVKCNNYAPIRCADKVNVRSGNNLYEKSRDELKNVFGMSDGTRLFSHMQKDKARVRWSEQEQCYRIYTHFWRMHAYRRIII